MNWIKEHSFEILTYLTIVITAIPVIANVYVRLARKYSDRPGDRLDRSANWVAAKAPLILADLVWARDAIVHPEQLFRIEKAAENVANVAKRRDTVEDADVVIASVRLNAAVEAAKDVTPPIQKPPPFVPILIIGLAFTFGGCGASLAQIKQGVGDVSLAVSQLDPMLHKVYEAEQLACPGTEAGDACVADVRSMWRPIIEVMQKIRVAWCALDPKAEGCTS